MMSVSDMEFKYFSKHPDALREVYKSILNQITDLDSARILRNQMEKVITIGIILRIPLWSHAKHIKAFSIPSGMNNRWSHNKRIHQIHKSRQRTPVHPNLGAFYNNRNNWKHRRYLHNHGGFER